MACLLRGISVWAGDPLFGSGDVLSISIRGPLTALARASDTQTDVPGWIEVGDSGQIPMTFTKFGVSRLEECGVPSLVITVDPNTVSNTTFVGREQLWLVTPCHHTPGYDKLILLEYLVYRSYAVIASPALHVRLVNLRYRDSEKPSVDENEYAFLLEDIGDAAKRHDMRWLDIRSQPMVGLDPEQLSRLALFQYMVGNTDWSALSVGGDGRCCHNIAILGGDESGPHVAMPFDFDQSGLVNAPYAFPEPRLKISSVTERVYRGYCAHNDHLPEAVELFNEKRAEIVALFNQDNLPYPKVRKRALKYLDGFYNTVNDRRKFEKKIINACR